MPDNQDKISQLVDKVEILLKKQDAFSSEINSLRAEINKLKISGTQEATEKEELKEDIPVDTAFETETDKKITGDQISQQQPAFATHKTKAVPKIAANLEKFIGENLLNKIGIIITVLGVAIGAKYSIENELISPLTRIVLGYLAGIGILSFGIKLKKNHKDYSAVLVSGAMAILYFITYVSYSFYDLIPHSMAFGLLLILTAFTVIAAVKYSNQIIALIGLVGAYAIPFLLNEGSGNVEVLFSYMAIINFGILVLGFKRYWKALYYSSFGLTWLIFLLWYITDYQTSKHFAIALGFHSLFFVTFYLTFLAYKLLQKEKFIRGDLVLLLANSFVFYGFGFGILNNHETGEELLGAFTLGNGIVHFIVSAVIFRQKLADRNLFYLVSGLVLIFLTITIPVQLDGNWVTLLWAGEAALLFWIGRTKKVPVYEILSYPLIFLAFFSLVHDWFMMYGNYYPENPETRLTPLWNINFLTSFLFIAAFGFINYLNQNKSYLSSLHLKKLPSKFLAFTIPTLLLLALYYAFRIEIATYWTQLYIDSTLTINTEGQQYSNYYRNVDLLKFKTIWIINYSLLFISVLSILNHRKFRDRKLGIVSVFLLILVIGVFLTQGLYVLGELRENYLQQTLAEYYHIGTFNLGIRYVSFTFVAFAIFVCQKYRKGFLKGDYSRVFDFLLHSAVLWIASSELIHWMEISESAQSYKLGLSILWGIYSLLLIVLGIWKNKKYIRIGAIALFGVTLVKLFFYDISHLNTIAKTIVLVSLGVVLLIISFLYNKYKHKISLEIDI